MADGDKVEQISGIIGHPKTWDVVEQTGELVLVDVPGRPGAKQKMRKSRRSGWGCGRKAWSVKREAWSGRRSRQCGTRREGQERIRGVNDG
jgi:hypothetical protein